MNKVELGQFYTTNYHYILKNLVIPSFIKEIIEPFSGEGHLAIFAKNCNSLLNIIEYDIEPKKNNIIKRDTLLYPPEYESYYIITNPPYLARNKSNNKEIFDKYNENDLYKCFLRNIIQNNCQGGIIIIPLNFFCSCRQSDIKLRKEFMNIYQINFIRIFEEPVFDDTSYTVCVVQFTNKKYFCLSKIKVELLPKNESFEIIFNEENNYTFGGEIFNLLNNNNISINRLTKYNIGEKKSNLLLKCIDDDENNKLGLYFKENNDDLFIDNTDKSSARAYATLIINPYIEIEQQKALAESFNNYINEKRNFYHSLFLTNYRESKNNFNRKRISMNLAYQIINFLLQSE